MVRRLIVTRASCRGASLSPLPVLRERVRVRVFCFEISISDITFPIPKALVATLWLVNGISVPSRASTARRSVNPTDYCGAAGAAASASAKSCRSPRSMYF